MKRLRFICLIIVYFCLSGCGFTMRNNKPFPRVLHSVYIASEKPNSLLTTKLKALLTSHQTSLQNGAHDAPISLVITNDVFNSSRAAVLNANLPSTISYHQTATITIKNNKTNSPIAARSFSSSQALLLNANQINMPTNEYEIKNTLNQDIVTQIYYWLISTNLKNILQHANHN